MKTILALCTAILFTCIVPAHAAIGPAPVSKKHRHKMMFEKKKVRKHKHHSLFHRNHGDCTVPE